MASKFLLQEGMNDVILKIRHDGDGVSWRMPAHSLFLIKKSSIFQQMLDERPVEEKPVQLTFIGMRPETAEAVLKYIYEDEFPAEVTADLLIAAKKYGLQSLQDNVEERLMEDITVLQACQVLDELNIRNPVEWECTIKKTCQEMLEMHALTIFGSDMIMCLSKQTLCKLLCSDRLNIPDEAYVFWGIWRWGRRQCSMNSRSLRDEDVAAYIDDMIVCIRKSSVRNKSGIPPVASGRFDSRKCRRSHYVCPPDILKHVSLLRPCHTWEDIIPPKLSDSEEGPLCIQLSVEQDVMLVGLYLEMCAHDRVESFIRVIRESDSMEVRRQKIGWYLSSMRRLSPRGDPECRLEAEVTFHTPLFLIPGNVYSVQLLGNFRTCHFVWGSLRKRRVKVGNSFVNFHGDGVTAVREIYIIPDVTVTWGPRIVEA